MPIKYSFDPELHDKTTNIAKTLFPYIDVNRIKCFRSYGSATRNTIARCHAIGKLMQMTIGVKAHYGIEFISENFDRLSIENQTKTIIHELMHIPKSFGGGFKHHDYVCDKNINIAYNQWQNLNNTNNNETKNKSWW